MCCGNFYITLAHPFVLLLFAILLNGSCGFHIHARHMYVLPRGYAHGEKGFCMRECRKTCIVINSDLPEIIQQIILIHEIGHALLHQKTLQIKCFHDFELFDGVSQCEYEANCFAADYLLEDEDVLEMLNADMSFFQAAAELKVPPELLDFKFRMMKRSGVQIIDSPITSNSDFLKDIPTSGIIENY